MSCDSKCGSHDHAVSTENNTGEAARMMSAVYFALLCLLSGAKAKLDWKDAGPPTWAKTYNITGTLRLPYAEIVEDFTAYYDAANMRSRVDYYSGTVKTIQMSGKKPDFGKSYKVAPMTPKGKVESTMACFLVNGTKDAKVDIQAVLPDTTGFKKIQDNVIYGGKSCIVWQNILVNGTRKNTYTLWVNKENNHPVRYEMMGYDSLLGSHYDKYYIDYGDYTVLKEIKPDVFNLSKVAPKVKCGGFPGPGMEDHRLLMNPMMEYINNYRDHLDPMFDHFKKHNGKHYHGKEHQQRQNTFMHNLRFIHSHNRGGHSFSVAVNHLADWTDAERKALRGRRPTKGYNGGLPFDKHKYDVKDLPDQMDWTLYGAVTPVKDQAVCGSCWSFGTTGTIEGAHFLRTGNLVRLSQQELIDCSWGQGNNGCDGGEDFRAYAWIKKHGLAAEDAYGTGNYLGQDGYCRAANATPVVATLKGYVNVTSGDLQALKIAIAHFGPISVAIDASVRSFSFYANGVYYEPKCGSTPDDLDHAVLAVGYGTINGRPYWLVKNSWSTYWGNDGYVLMSQKGNNCGVATDPTYVLI